MTMRASVARALHVFLGFFSLAGSCTSLANEIELTRINACKDISDVFSRLRGPSTGCRTEMGVIDRAIRDFASGSEANLCFMERPPAASLASFRCVQSSYRGGRSISCYRTAPSSLLADYKTNYVKKYASQASSYIEEAKRCPGSNGDASRIIESTFPPVFRPVAEHDFGFNVQYGDTKPGSALVSHGFARTAPEVSKRGPDAIEYLVFSDGPMKELPARTPHGNWRLRLDTSPDFAAPFVKALKRQGLPTYLSAFDVDIERSPRASALPKNPPLPEELSRLVASRLEDEGFEEMSDETLEKHTGKTRKEMNEAIFKEIAFGARNFFNGRTLQFRILMKDSGLPCTQGGRGAVGAYLFTFEGQKDVQVNFGSVSASVLGFGSCASSANHSREYVRNLAEESKQVILNDLQGR
ncbi:hypothetical protein D3C86_823470 [compost metagenome]